MVKRIENSRSSGTGGIDYIKDDSVTDSANYSETSIRRRNSLSFSSKIEPRQEDEVPAAKSRSKIEEVKRASTGSQDDGARKP